MRSLQSLGWNERNTERFYNSVQIESKHTRTPQVPIKSSMLGYSAPKLSQSSSIRVRTCLMEHKHFKTSQPGQCFSIKVMTNSKETHKNIYGCFLCGTGKWKMKDTLFLTGMFLLFLPVYVKTKTKTWKIIILPVILHGWETRSQTLKKEKSIHSRVSENKVLRKVFGAKRWSDKGLENTA
jgi:hypothetical protein